MQHQDLVLGKDKIRHIMQFEKVIEKFASKIGLDKKTFLKILSPPEPESGAGEPQTAQSMKKQNFGRPQTSQDFRTQMDTG